MTVTVTVTRDVSTVAVRRPSSGTSRARGRRPDLCCGHSRWTAAAREMARQYWGTDAGFTLVMLSSELARGALLPRRHGEKGRHHLLGRHLPDLHAQPCLPEGVPVRQSRGRALVDPHLHPTPRSSCPWPSGRGHRLPRWARPWPTTTHFAVVDSPSPEGRAGGTLGLLAPLAPDVTLVHGAVADEQGNVALSDPCLEGPWGGVGGAARRDRHRRADGRESRGLGHRTKIPAHRVLAVVEAPFGAHPGGSVRAGAPVPSYGEDIPFWTEARDATQGDFDDWARKWVLEPETHDAYLDSSAPRGWRDSPRVPIRSPGAWTQRAIPWTPPRCRRPRSVLRVHATCELRGLVTSHRANAVLAGAGVANLAAWVAVARCRRGRDRVGLTAELGCGATPRRRPTRTSSTTASFRTPLRWPTPRRCSAWWSGGRERRWSVPGRGPGRPRRQSQLDRHPGRSVPGGVGRSE